MDQRQHDRIESICLSGPLPGTLWLTLRGVDLYSTRLNLSEHLEPMHTGAALVLAVVAADISPNVAEPYAYFDVLVLMRRRIGWLPFVTMEIWRKSFVRMAS